MFNPVPTLPTPEIILLLLKLFVYCPSKFRNLIVLQNICIAIINLIQILSFIYYLECNLSCEEN